MNAPSDSSRSSSALLAYVILIVFMVLALAGFGFHEMNQDAQIEPTVERLEVALANISEIKDRVSALEEDQALGASTELPSLKAFFETSLAAKITNSATSFTLVSATDKAGVTLASSTYAFVIDEGTALEEMVLADCTATACTNATRGLSVTTGTTSVTALRFPHGRGATVKITDGPILLIHNRLLQGVDNFPNLLKYKTTTVCDSSSPANAICDINYIRNIAGAGGATSTESRGGFVELGTALETASSTDLGADKPTVLQTKNATDTPQYGCATGYTGTAGAGCTVIATLTGKIRQAWINLSEAWTFLGAVVFDSTATFNGTVTFNGAVTGNGLNKYGGTGADGALSITSGTTNIDLANATTTIKNYTSISITGTGVLGFTNPATKGSIVVLKSTGDCTITSSATRAIDLRGIGAAASTSAAYIPSEPAVEISDRISNYGLFTDEAGKFQAQKRIYIIPGQGGQPSTGAVAGGRGGGALILECAGALNFTGTIDASGAAGTSGGAGGGGGGSAGMVFISYGGALTAGSGTITTAGGAGGGASSSGSGGKGAGSIYGTGGTFVGGNNDGQAGNGKGAGGGGGSSSGASTNGGAGGASAGGIIVKNTEL